MTYSECYWWTTDATVDSCFPLQVNSHIMSSVANV